MKTIQYLKLYDYCLNEEKLTNFETLRVIWRVRQLPNEYKLLVSQVIENDITSLENILSFECNGVSLKELLEYDMMSPINAILFLDWLRREPSDALQLLYSGYTRSKLSVDEEFSSDEENKIIVEKALDKLVANNPSFKNKHAATDKCDTAAEDILIIEEDVLPESNVKDTADNINVTEVTDNTLTDAKK